MDKNKNLKMNEFDRWFNDGGDLRYRYNYDLNNESIVFDVGGYEGNFSQKIILTVRSLLVYFKFLPELIL